MTDYATQASYYRAALLLGLISGANVVAWADEIVVRDARAPEALLNVAMVPPGDLSELRHALQPLATHDESVATIRALFDIARRDLTSEQRTVQDTITVLAQARRFLTLPASYFDEIDTLQDDFMLASAAVVGNTPEVETRVRRWLSQFDGAATAFLEESAC